MKNYYQIYYSNSEIRKYYQNNISISSSSSKDFNSLSNYMKGLLSMKRALKRREEKREWLIHRIQSHQLILLKGEKSEYELEEIERYIKNFLMVELSSIEREIKNYKLKIEKYQER